MNLHQIASGAIAAVNPQVPVTVRISTGPSAPDAAGKRTPTFATPGAFTAAIADDVMTVSAVASGKLLAGQAISGASVAAGTVILEQLTGDAGGPGTYSVAPEQIVASEAMTSALTMPAQIQSLTFKDLTQIEGLNLQGERRAIYFYGDNVKAIVRPTQRGGDLVTFPDGSVWLVAIVLESWPGWCKCACTLQNGG